MDDYIKRDSIIELMDEVLKNNKFLLEGERTTLAILKSKVLTTPAANVREIKYAHWEECCNELDKYCTNCQKMFGTIYENENFCPHCGADMTGG